VSPGRTTLRQLRRLLLLVVLLVPGSNRSRSRSRGIHNGSLRTLSLCALSGRQRIAQGSRTCLPSPACLLPGAKGGRGCGSCISRKLHPRRASRALHPAVPIAARIPAILIIVPVDHQLRERQIALQIDAERDSAHWRRELLLLP
jgi:hypothetical protein